MQPGEDTAALLASVDVFADLEERELAEIASVAVPRTFERGEILFREGDTGDSCYVVRSGAVIIRRDHASGSGRSLTLAEFRTGAFFGELAMFGGETRSATAGDARGHLRGRAAVVDIQRVTRTSPADRPQDVRRAGRPPARRQRAAARSSRSRRCPAAWPGRCLARSWRARRRRARRRAATSWCAPPRPRSPSWRAPRARAPAASWPAWSGRVSFALDGERSRCMSRTGSGTTSH